MNYSFIFKLFLFFPIFFLFFQISPLDAKKKNNVKKSKIIVASVNGHKITLADIEFRLSLLSSAMKLRVKKNKRKFLESIVRAELLFQEAKRLGVGSKKEVIKLSSMTKKRIFKDFLLKERVYSDVKVEDEVLKNFFTVHRERFKRKESVTLSHIVVSSKESAFEILKFIKSGEIFSNIARSRSIYKPTRKSGGVLGTVEKGTLPKKVEKLVFALPVGQVSKPVKTRLGWEIFRVSEHVTAKDAKYEDVKENLRMFFIQSKQNERYRSLMKKLEKKSNTKIFLKNFK
tara:strand:+ start:6373 stop:7233 length:861 start_codon:yes stop_codon:yes gene_type:complete